MSSFTDTGPRIPAYQLSPQLFILSWIIGIATRSYPQTASNQARNLSQSFTSGIPTLQLQEEQCTVSLHENCLPPKLRSREKSHHHMQGRISVVEARCYREIDVDNPCNDDNAVVTSCLMSRGRTSSPSCNDSLQLASKTGRQILNAAWRFWQQASPPKFNTISSIHRVWSISVLRTIVWGHNRRGSRLKPRHLA